MEFLLKLFGAFENTKSLVGPFVFKGLAVVPVCDGWFGCEGFVQLAFLGQSQYLVFELYCRPLAQWAKNGEPLAQI